MSDPINILALLPTLFTALDCLAPAYFDAGWFLGCLTDVAVAVLPAIIHQTPDSNLHATKALAVRYLKDHGAVDSDTPCGAADAIDLDELVMLMRAICVEEDERSVRNVPGAWPQGEHEEVIEERFCLLLRGAVVDYLFDGRFFDIQVGLLDAGWEQARMEHATGLSSPLYPGVDGERLFHIFTERFLSELGYPSPSLAGYEADSDWAPSLSSSAASSGSNGGAGGYSAAYTASTPPDGVCVICLDVFASGDDSWGRDLVVAACGGSHVFHGVCLDTWVTGDAKARTCPICRGVLCRGRARARAREGEGD